MNKTPSQKEIDEVYSALYELFQKYMIYGVPKPTLLNVLEFWNELGKEEMERLDSLKYDKDWNIVGMSIKFVDEK